MKSVLISIHPKYCYLIAKGEKTIEVRKSKPKLELPFKCYIYCTASDKSLGLLSGNGTTDLIVCSNWKTAIPVGGEICNGKIIGEFICDSIRESGLHDNYCKVGRYKETAIDALDLMDYAGNKRIYGWHISEFKLYSTPKALSEFKRYNRTEATVPCAHTKWLYEPCETCKECNLTRPPQSWCYVEERSKINANL